MHVYRMVLMPENVFNILEWLNEAIIKNLRAGCLHNFQGLFDTVNSHILGAGGDLSKSPADFLPPVFQMIRSASETILMPIAGMIITFVFCYELIAVVTEKNNLHDFDVMNIFKVIFKAALAVVLLSHAFDFVMAFFDVGQFIASKLAQSSATVGQGMDIEGMLATETNFWSLLGTLILLWICKLAFQIISVVVTIAIWLRFFEMYLYSVMAPLPFATFMNREWGQLGLNYVRKILALAFQAFLMLICLSIYSAMVNSLGASTDFVGTLLKTLEVTAALAVVMFKTGQISNSIFNAQ